MHVPTAWYVLKMTSREDLTHLDLQCALDTTRSLLASVDDQDLVARVGLVMRFVPTH